MEFYPSRLVQEFVHLQYHTHPGHLAWNLQRVASDPSFTEGGMKACLSDVMSGTWPSKTIKAAGVCSDASSIGLQASLACDLCAFYHVMKPLAAFGCDCRP